MPRIDAFLELGREQGASDVHFAVGMPPLLRIHGELNPVRYRALSDAETQAMLDEILADEHLETFERDGAVDLSYDSPSAGRFRFNLCREAAGTSAVCRVIPDRVFALEELGLPPVLATLPHFNAGLVLVTGATGTGKSTTLASILDGINSTRKSTIITLEDPIEMLHESKKSLVIQRELGIDVPSFAEGLRSALRQDPDVLLVGELRDLDTIALALEASETGHLVLATLHTRGAAQTVDRILDTFPPDQHGQVRHTLADNLRCIVSQELVRDADGRGRRPVAEILVVTTSVSQLIREGKTFHIPNVIATGRRHGMQLMDQAVARLVEAGDADPDDARRVLRDRTRKDGTDPASGLEAA